MGYYMTQRSCDFHIEGHNFEPALVAVKKLCMHVLSAETLPEALSLWGWGAFIDEDGHISDIQFEREKAGNESELFGALAPYVTVGSYIEMSGEDGHLWRWTFPDGKTCVEIEAIISWVLPKN